MDGAHALGITLRTARWRQTRAEATAATLARLQAEKAALRQRVGERERLVGQLKRKSV